MVQHITAADSVDKPTGTAFSFSSAFSETLLFDANAFLISQSGGNGAFLAGPLTATINGQLEAFGSGWAGVEIFPNSPSDVANVRVGRSGDLFGDGTGLLLDGLGTIINQGTISGNTNGINASNGDHVTINNSGLIQGGTRGLALGTTEVTIINSGTIRGPYAILSTALTQLTNSGILDGKVSFFDGNDVFTDFKKVGHIIKSGTVSGVIDLDLGNDLFKGGNNNEKVQDAGGADTYSFGGGNDYYIAVSSNGVSGDDIVNGGSGIDIYDASAATSSVTIWFDIGQAFASFLEIGTDNITGFETAIGGSGQDFLHGNSSANTLIGSAGNDQLTGFGGHDTLTGGGDADGFFFTKLSDSGTKAATRDVITDFSQLDGDYINLIALETSIGKNLFFIDRANFTHTAGEIRESFSGGDTIVSADVNGDGKADFSILLKGHHLLDDFAFAL